MRKKLISVLIVFAAVLALPIAASASNYGFEQGDYVQLNGYRFIVLDPTTNYLFADFYLENRKFNTNNSNVYNPSHPNHVAYYLNSIFLKNLGDISN